MRVRPDSKPHTTARAMPPDPDERQITLRQVADRTCYTKGRLHTENFMDDIKDPNDPTHDSPNPKLHEHPPLKEIGPESEVRGGAEAVPDDEDEK
jgi:hypothetical protein